MYKRFNFQELKTIKSNFIQNLNDVISKEKTLNLKDFFKKIFKFGDEVNYFNRGYPIFSFNKIDGHIRYVDEKEKIEIVVPDDAHNKVQTLINGFASKKKPNTSTQTIVSILTQELKNGRFNTILDKPYIVYDIETNSDIENLKETEFYIAYSMEVTKDNKTSYDYIDKNGLKGFVNKLLNFDGYIVGFNNIYFDNPVCIHNVGGTEEDIKKINNKSIDILVFVQEMIGKRIGLNKIASALVGIEKTLDSGLQGEVLRKKYIETKDINFLEEFKKYCKNDVKMTALVLCYLLYYKKIFYEGQQINYTIEEFVEKSRTTNIIVDENLQNNKLIY